MVNRKNFCDSLFNIDDNIRFVGIVNNEGEVVEGGFKNGIKPLLSVNEEQEMYLQSLSNVTFFQSFSKKFGPMDYLLTRHKKISIITIPFGKEILCISVSSNSDIDKIRDILLKKVLDVFKK